MKALKIILLVGFFCVLLYASCYLPHRGDLNAPAQQDYTVVGSPVAGQYFIRNAYAQTHTDNMVTVVLGDYRAFDTLGETIVVFAAGIACILILRRRKP